MDMLDVLGKLPETFFRVLGLVFFIGVVAWRATYYGKYSTSLWAAETGIYVTIAVAYLRRTPAIERARAWYEVVLPLVGAPLPFALQATLVDGKPAYEPVNLVVPEEVAFGLMLAGAVVALVSYVFLGGSFAILVEARELKQTGPYRWVRHPVYAGQIVAGTGVLLMRFSTKNIVVFVLLVGVQVARALLEERKLARAIPAYAEYRERTWRFVPFIF